MKQTEFQGIRIKLDRPKGFIQRGKDSAGKTWERVYKVDYGFIPKTQGGDGDGLDVFLGPHQDSQEVFWVIQKKEDGSFDEYKVILGARSREEARKIYTDHVPPKFLKGMVRMGLPMLKALVGVEPFEKIACLVSFLDELGLSWGSK